MSYCYFSLREVMHLLPPYWSHCHLYPTPLSIPPMGGCIVCPIHSHRLMAMMTTPASWTPRAHVVNEDDMAVAPAFLSTSGKAGQKIRKSFQLTAITSGPRQPHQWQQHPPPHCQCQHHCRHCCVVVIVAGGISHKELSLSCSSSLSRSKGGNGQQAL